MRFDRIAASLFLIGLLAAPSVKLEARQEAFSARNFTSAEKEYQSVSQQSLAGLLWAPRHILNGTLYGMEQTATYLSDPDFIEKVKDILYIRDPELLWYPVVDYNSGFRPSYGAGLRYRENGIKADLQGKVWDADLWEMKFKNSYRTELSSAALDFHWDALMSKENDLSFSGFGADPKNDSRNYFLTDEKDAVFAEDKRRLGWGVSLEEVSAFSFHYSGFWMRRAFQDHGWDDDDLRDVFRSQDIPGFTAGAPVSQIYNEIAIEVDTRKNDKILEPGFRGEIYNGLSAGIRNNKANLIRAGGDLQGFIPITRPDRLIVPRFVLDLTDDINGEDVPFSEYPRQPTFRGVSEREWVRTDNVSVVPSIEYQWRLSHILAAHLFFDYLTVGKTLSTIEWDDGLWAAGTGLDFHTKDKEWGRVELAGGSEGFQAKVSIGMPVRKGRRG